MDRCTVRLKPVPPFDFDLTAGYHASFQGRYAVDQLVDGAYTRLIDINGRLLLVATRSVGSVGGPELDVDVSGEYAGEDDATSASQMVGWMLGAATELGEFYAMAREDSVLGSLVRQLYGLHPPHTASVFEALVMAITSQQIATTVARHIRALMVQNYGAPLCLEGRTFYAFPTPESILSAGVPGLRNIKLSTRKAEYILDIASKAHQGSLSRESFRDMPEPEIREQFTSIRGVGAWTWQWLQIRALGLPDGFPSGDLALRRIVSHLYFGDSPTSEQEVEEFSRRWSPCRSLATVYLFAASRMGLLGV